MTGCARLTVIAANLLRAYSRNSGNNFLDHYDQGAAIQWMESALEEVGVDGLLEACDAVVAYHWLASSDEPTGLLAAYAQAFEGAEEALARVQS